MNLDANDLHFSIDDEPKALLAGEEQESKELMNCGKLPVDGMDNKRLHSTCSTVNDETVTQGNAVEEVKPDVEGSTKFSQVPQNTDYDDVQQDEDFIAKDLLCFGWQIARGMVSTERMLLTNRMKQRVITKKCNLGDKATLF